MSEKRSDSFYIILGHPYLVLNICLYDFNIILDKKSVHMTHEPPRIVENTQ